MQQRIFWVGLLAILGLSFAAACSQTSASSPSPVVIAESTGITTVAAENMTGGSLTAMYDQFYGAAVYLDGNTVVINTDDVPDHQSPYFQPGHPQYTAPHAGMIKNPGEILTQDITLRVPLNPAVSSASDTSLGAIGVAVNGVVFFNQYAAGFQALDDEILTFDLYNGHPAPPMGVYHYHVEPVWLTADPSSLIGVLLDGFPVYGPLDRGGGAPSDLDICHGHTGVTSEFPEGIYHYHAASEPPYISGCFRGEPGTALN